MRMIVPTSLILIFSCLASMSWSSEADPLTFGFTSPTAAAAPDIQGEVLLDHVDKPGGTRLVISFVAAPSTAADGSAQGTLEVLFQPLPDGQWHYYAYDHPETGVEFMPGAGAGRPTKITLSDGQAFALNGQPTITPDPIPYTDTNLEIDYEIYPEGSVIQSYPVTFDPTRSAATTVKVWYMLCNPETCLQARSGVEFTLPHPGQSLSDASTDQVAVTNETPGGSEPSLTDPTQDTDHQPAPPERGPAATWLYALIAGLVSVTAWGYGLIGTAKGQATSLRKFAIGLVTLTGTIVLASQLAPPTKRGNDIAWEHPSSANETEALIEAAHAQGQAALLDFTGPACANCLTMAKNHFGKPEVAAAWHSGVPIELDTDTHSELGRWQVEQFNRYDRPLYVRIEPDGTTNFWSRMVGKDDETGVSELIAFLEGRATDSSGDIGSGWDSGLAGLIITAILGGLFTLIMPCTYPMIPITITFFTKQADSGRKPIPLAACYALGIIGCFTGIGVILSAVFQISPTDVSGNPITNLIIGSVFIAFGLSLLGAFLLRLPSSITNVAGGARSGYAGALLMGLTFAITAFTCTAPIAGLVLGEAMKHGTWLKATGAMIIYASTIAIPFFFLALSPQAMQKMPKAGGWMTDVKVVGGLVEIGAAFKFLAVTDVAWSLNLLSREIVLGIWAACALTAGAYLLGMIRLPDSSPLQRIAVVRWLIGLLFVGFGIYATAGVLGTPLTGVLEGLIPYVQSIPRW